MKNTIKSTQLLIQAESLLKYLALFIKAIPPNSNCKLVWDTLILLNLLFVIFYVPLKVSFNCRIESFILNHFPFYCFLLEIVLNFNTAYYSRGYFVFN